MSNVSRKLQRHAERLTEALSNWTSSSGWRQGYYTKWVQEAREMRDLEWSSVDWTIDYAPAKVKSQPEPTHNEYGEISP